MNLSGLGRSIFDRIINGIRSVRMRKTTTWIITIAMMLSIFSVMFPAVAAEAPPAVAVQILSPFEILEPSTKNNANDKDGYPPQTSSADVEEGIIQCEIIVTSTIDNPYAELLDDNADAIDDLTIDDDNPRDLDLLDGVDDNALAPGTYYVYWNLDKTGYVPVNTTHGALYNGSNSASISVVGDIEYYTVKLSHSDGGPVYSPQFTITMQNSASIKQNDLDWLQTAPDQVFAETGDIFSVRTLYHQNSANGLQHLISQVYDVGDNIRLLNISIYYFNDFHPGNISAGVPASWTTAFFNTIELTPAELTTTDNRDHWVMEYTFEVIAEEFSFLIPYTQTIKKGSTWKVDTGYEGFQSWVPGGINPANLTIEKYFSESYTDGIVSGPNPPVVGYETVYELNITVENIGGDRAVNVLVTDTIPLSNVTWENTYSASKGTLTYYNSTGYFEWNVGTLNKNSSATLSFQVSVTPTEADIGYKILLNTGAYVQGTSEYSGQPVEDGPTPPLETEPVIAGAPTMTLAKTVTEATAYPGEVLHYEIEVENTGSATAGEVWVNDTMPADTTFKECSPNYYSLSGNSIKWHFINFTTGTTIIYLNVTASTSLNDGDKLNNTVEMTYSDFNNKWYPAKYDWAVTDIIAPIMTLDKVADQSTADPGDIITYTIYYANVGTGTASEVWINDTIPGFTTYFSSNPTYTSKSGLVYTWHLTNVTPGNYSIELKLKVDIGAPDGTILSNGVTLNYKAPPGVDYPEEEDEENVTVTAPVMTISKDADSYLADPGDEITYTITYKNTGTGDAKNVWVNDTIPADTTFVSATAGYSVSGDTYMWHFTNVAPGTYNITIKVKVDVGTGDGTKLVNNVTLDYTDANGNQPYDTQWDTTTVTVTAPIMTIGKDADLSTANPGDMISYTIKYENTGTGLAGNVWINDTIPSYTTYHSSSPTYDYKSGNVYTWHFTNVAPGTFYITLNVTVDVGTPDGTKLVDNVTLEYTDTNGNQPYSLQWDTAETTVTAPVMTVQKDVDKSSANPGDELTYTITYQNTGTGDAKNVWINDTIDPETTFVSATPTYTSVSGDTYTWHFTSVAPGTYYITLKVKVDVGTADGSTLTNNVDLEYTDANGNQPYQKDSDDATTTITAPIMTVQKDVDKSSANPGDELTYTITYKNTGTGTAKNVWINDTIDPDTTYVSSTPTYTSVSGDTYTWHFTNVAAGTYNITLKVKVDVGVTDSTVLTNNVDLEYTDANGNQPYPKESDDATTTVTAPDFSITKVADASTADPADVILYTITYKNTGTGTAKDVWVNDTIPGDTTFINATPTYDSVSGDTYTWHFTNVVTGTYQIFVNVKVDVGTPDGTKLINKATLDYTDFNGNQPYGTIEDTAEVLCTSPVMTITKTVDSGIADPGDMLTYTIKYENNGGGTAKDVWIKDTIPADTTYVSSSPVYTSVSGDTYTWHITNVAPGTYYITLKVTVDVGTVDGTSMVNNATLDYNDANGNSLPQEWDTATTTATAPVMTIEKVADVSTAAPGDVITYTITYKNTGTGDAKNVWVNDTIPADTTYVSASPAYDSVSGDTYGWHLTNVAPGTYNITLKVKVDVGTSDGKSLTNDVSLDYTDANGNQPYATQWDDATTTVAAPVMTIYKDVDMANADPGDELTYTITYKNLGSTTAKTVWINDTIPADTTFVSATPTYTSVSGDTYTWVFNNVAAGTYNITLKVKVDVGTADGTILVNNVTLDYTDSNGNQPYATQWDTATTTVTAPIMSIDKVVDVATADPDDELNYNITYKNTGTGTAKDVWVKDTIPADTTFVSSTPMYTSVSGDTYTWHFTNVAPGTYYINIKVKVDVGTPDTTVLTNNVTLDYTDANGNPYGQQWDTATTTVTAPDMTISKGVDLAQANPGDELVYTIKYENTGTGIAKDVWVKDTIPADTTYVSSTPAYTSVSGDTYTWHFINVGAGTYYITLKVKVDVGTPDQTVLTNNVTLDYSDANGNPYAQQWDTATTTVTAPMMSIDKVVDAATADPGDVLTYTITYKNTGTGVAKDVWVKDTIPADTTYVSSSPAYTSVSGDTYTWHITNVAPGTYNITLKVKVDVGATDGIDLTNNATLDYTDANGNPYPQTWDTATTKVTSPVMTISKTSDKSSADPGDEITYIIKYENTGTGTAKTVWVNDTIPADTTFVSATPTYTSVSGDTYTWIFNNVTPGAYYITLKVKVDVGTPDQTILMNNVTLDYTDANGNQPYATQWDTATTTVTAPIMTIDKVVDAATADPGDELNYNITYKNTGTGNAKDVWVKDTIPADTTFVSSTPMYTSVSGDTYTWHFTNVAPGTYYINIKVKVDVGTPDQTVMTNNATLDYTDANGNPYTQEWDMATTTVTAPIMSIDKVVDAATADPGDELNYNITYKNTGTGTAKDVWVKDTIPADTTFVSSTPMYTSVSGDTYSWHFTNVAPGTYYINIKVKVIVGTPDQTILTNNATLDYNDANGNPYAQQWDTTTTTVTAPVMSIDKVVDLCTADPDDELIYTITYKNTGTGIAKDVWVKDTIPADTTYVSSAPVYTSVSGDTYTWHFINVGAGTYYITLKVKVDVGTPDQTVLTNNVTLDYSDANGNPYAQQWDTATTTVTAPVIEIQKDADLSIANPGDVITYTIKYSNTGTGNSANVYIKDTIPTDTTYVSSTPTYTSVSGNTYTWHFTNVTPGNYSITLKVKVNVGTTDKAVLTNYVTMDYSDANDNYYPQKNDTATTTITAPVMTIDKTVDVANADPGDELTYNITYKNTGTGTAKDVWVNDTIPADTTYVSSSPAYTSVSGDTYTWHFTNVGTGTYYITLKVKVDVGTPDQTVLINNVTLDYTDANGNQPYMTQWDTATTTVTAPIISIDKVVDAVTADPGDVLTYTITYNSTGTGIAKDVWVKDTIPADTTYVSSSPVYTSVSGDTYTWHFTNVGTGTYNITLKVKVDVGTPDQTVLTNNVTLDYSDANGNPYAQQWDTATTTVTAPVITVSKSVDASTANPGDVLTYTIKYENTGTGVAATVWIKDTIPADTTYVSSSPVYTSVSGDTYTWVLSNVANGTYYITLKVKVDVGTPDQTVLTNNVTLDYTDANGNPYLQTWDTATTTVTAPVITVSKSVDASTADPGDVLTYTIKYENTGTGLAKEVWIKDTIPADTTWVSSTPAYTSVSGDTYTWHFTNVTTGAYYITIKVVVDVGTPDQTVLLNNATLDYTDANGNSYPQTWDTATTTATAPIMSIDKVVDAATADPGDELTYTITFKNTGTGVAAHVWINDTLPSNVIFVSANFIGAAPDSFSIFGTLYKWHFSNIGTGTYYIKLKVKVKVGTADQTVLVNNVTLDYTDANGNQPYPMQWDKATTTVTAPVMSIDKVADVATADPDDQITYTITYKNTGTGIAGTVWINDTIPSDTTFVSAAPAYTSVSGDTYTWVFTNVGTGTYTITIKVKVDAYTPDKTVLWNNVTLDYTDVNGNQPYATDSDFASVTVTAPVMGITKIASAGTAVPGDIITYTITVVNTGTGVAGTVWVDDTIPAATVFQSSTPAYTSVSGNTYTWKFTNFANGTKIISINVKVPVGTPDKTVLFNNATLDYTDANGNLYPQSWDTATTVVTAPVMSISKVVDAATADPGDVLTYTINYQNTGTGIAKNVWINDTIPADTTFVSSTPAFTSASGDTYTWHFTNVGTGSWSITIKVKVDVGTPDKTVLLNNATLDYTDTNNNQYPHTWDTATTTVTAPVMSIAKVVDVATADPGDEVVYTITYNNTGTGVAGHVWINDTIPADTTLVSTTPMYTSASGDTYTWHFTNVGTGSWSITIKVKVDVGTPDKTVLLNNATLDYTDANNNPYALQWDTAITVVTAPVMNITKEGGDIVVKSYVLADLTLRIAGEKWHDVTLTLYNGNQTEVHASVTRYPGDPDEQSLTVYGVKFDLSSPSYKAVIVYTPFDDPINGEFWGADPCWIILNFKNGKEERLHHTFNVRHNDTWVWIVDDFTPYLKKAPITYEIYAPYTITFNNTGTGVAAHVWVNDTIPAGTTLVSAMPNFTSVNGSTYSWYFTNVGTGTYYIYITVMKVINYTPAKTLLNFTNYVTLDYTDANGNQPYPTLAANATLSIWIPFMSISKAMDTEFGMTNDYVKVTLTVSTPLNMTTMRDIMPLGLEYTGNGVDDDSDGYVDEEALDGIDNDCDGLIDEDVGNFKINGGRITGGLSYNGHKLTYNAVPEGQHTITFDLIITENGMVNRVLTNTGEILYFGQVQNKDAAVLIYLAPNTPPSSVIDLPGDGSVFYEDMAVYFIGESSYDIDGNITYNWDFGDGETSNEMNPTHTFLNPGIYTVTLTVTDEDDDSDNAAIELTIIKNTPVAYIVNPDSYIWKAGHKIWFEGAADYIGNTAALEYEWQFGDGNYGYGFRTSYSYSIPGTYTVILTVSDGDGDSDQVTINITITSHTGPPKAPPEEEEKPTKDPKIIEPPNTGGAPPIPADPIPPEAPETPQEPADTPTENDPEKIYKWEKDTIITPPPSEPEKIEPTSKPIELIEPEVEKFVLFVPGHIPLGEDLTEEEILEKAILIVVGGTFISSTFIMEVVLPGKENEGEGEEGSTEDEETTETEDEE